MNRHYKKKTAKLHRVFVAYRDYARHTSCAQLYGVFDSLDEAIRWVEWDANFNERCGEKRIETIDYNKKTGRYVVDDHIVKGVGVRLGNRRGELYEIRLNATGDICDGNTYRYVVYQTYLNMQTV